MSKRFASLPLFALLTWLVLLLLAQANPYLATPGRDNGFFLYAGQQILQGKELYTQIWDHKGPAIFYLNAWGLALFNGYSWGVWILEYLFLFAALGVGYRAAQNAFGKAAALMGLLAGAGALHLVLGKGNLTEEYPLLFNFLSLFLFVRQGQKTASWHFYAIGALFGLSFLFRANNGGIPLSIGFTVLILSLLRRQYRSGFLALMGLALGALTVFGLAALFFWQRGTFSAFWEAAFTYNFLDTEGKTRFTRGLLAGLENFQLFIYPAAAGYAAALWGAWQNLRNRQTQSALFTWQVFLLLAFPLEVLLSSLSGKNFVHYFICWVPALFWLSAYAYHALHADLFSARVRAFLQTSAAPALFLLLTLVYSLPVLQGYGQTFYALAFNRQAGILKIDRVTDYLRNHTAPQEPVLVWGGEAGLNFLSGRQSPSRYNLFSRLLTPHPLNAPISEIFLQEILANPPVVIVDMWKKSPDSMPSLNPQIRQTQPSARLLEKYPAYLQLLAYLETHYTLETTIEGADLYRLKETPTP
jgi:4-amino-4-deoxy-L-arabinose transferase-like glycosyltransferase